MPGSPVLARGRMHGSRSGSGICLGNLLNGAMVLMSREYRGNFALAGILPMGLASLKE